MLPAKELNGENIIFLTRVLGKVRTASLYILLLLTLPTQLGYLQMIAGDNLRRKTNLSSPDPDESGFKGPYTHEINDECKQLAISLDRGGSRQVPA